MEYKAKNKILVTGPTSSGTTYTAMILAKMGIECGFDNKQMDTIQRRGKGLEFLDSILYESRFKRDRNQKGIDKSPRLVKRPILHQRGSAQKTFLDRANEWGWEVDHIIFCSREWEDRVESQKVREHTKRTRRRFNNDKFVAQQRNVLYQSYKMQNQAAEQEIPFSLISFPRSARDINYAWRCLKPVLELEGLADRDKFGVVFNLIAQEKMIHVG